MRLPEFIDKLQLNSYEKRVIVELAQVESATAVELVRRAGVPQGRIYSVLKSLQGKGMVQAIPLSPRQFAVKDVKQALSQYLEQEKQRISERQEELRRIPVLPKALPKLKSAASVAIYSGREEHLTAICAMRGSARQELLQAAPLFIGTFATSLSLEQALKRGVKARIIISRMTLGNRRAVHQAIAAGAEVRVSPSKEMLSMLIRDGEELLLGLQDHHDAEERVVVRSRNKGLLGAMRKQFLDQWNAAKPVLMRGGR